MRRLTKPIVLRELGPPRLCDSRESVRCCDCLSDQERILTVPAVAHTTLYALNEVARSKAAVRAFTIYRQNWNKPLHGKTFGEITLEDFAAFDKASLTHPDLSRMKWALEDLHSKAPSP